MRSLLLLLILPLSSAQDLPLRVESPRGVVRGFRADYGSNTSSLFYGAADIFLGIPFAKPPLPVPVCKYDKEIAEPVYKPRCPQVDGCYGEPAYNHSEDCLYLNVMSPSINVSRKYPVMVWIHGGGYQAGGADLYSYKGAIRNLVSRDVVIVTVQYRLSLLGFFTTYTPEFPPNRGAYDQLVALKWVQEEIEYYGGDPDRVTLFGESAGGVSVSALSLSPLSKGLFNQIAMDSGSMNLLYTVPFDPRGDGSTTSAEQICNVTGSLQDADSIGELQDCFANMTGDQLADYDMVTGVSWTLGPDGLLFPANPDVLAKSRLPMPMMVGDMQDEYAAFIPDVKNYKNFSRDTLVKQMQAEGLNYITDEDQLNQLVNMAIETYRTKPVDQFDAVDWTKMTSDAVTGMMFDSGMVQDVGWMRDGGASQIFLFTFNLHTPFATPITVEGWSPVLHATDLRYLWFYDYQWTPAVQAGKITWKDYAAADNLGRAFTDFAKRANPGWSESTTNNNFVYINENVEGGMKKWREPARVLYDVAYPSILTYFPPTNMSSSTEQMIAQLGKDLIQQWISCPPA